MFSRIIHQSGAWTHSGWRTLTQAEAVEVGQYGAEKLNCLKDMDEETIQCMQSLNPGDLVKESLFSDYYFSPPAAVIDGYVIPLLPHDIVASGDVNAREVIIGANEAEGLLDSSNFLLDPSLYDVLQKDWRKLGPMFLFGKRFGEKTDINEQVLVWHASII